MIYMPFLVKSEDWKPQAPQQQFYGSANESQYSVQMPTPRTDTQAFDLYIPLMAFVTYIIWAGVVNGALKDE